MGSRSDVCGYVASEIQVEAGRLLAREKKRIKQHQTLKPVSLGWKGRIQ